MDPTQAVAYYSNDLELFPSTLAQETTFERRILHWLEDRNLGITDPLQKQDSYYQSSKRKLEKFRSLRSGQALSEAQLEKDVSCSSLPSVSTLGSQRSLELIPEGSFLKESNTWRLKNRRRGTGCEQLQGLVYEDK